MSSQRVEGAEEYHRPLTLREQARAVVSCTSCSLHRFRNAPVVGSGPSQARLVLVGFVPGRHEDLLGVAFAGSLRNVLEHALVANGIAPEEVRFTSVVRCRPSRDRRPHDDEVAACSSHLRDELNLVAPDVVVSMGQDATSALLGRCVPLARVAGYRLDVLGGITLIPTCHPADAVRAGPSAVELQRHLGIAKAVLDGTLTSGAEVLEGLRSRATGSDPVRR